MYNFKENESLYATIVDTVTPTTSTEGVVGQFYIDQSTDPASLYLCTKVETVDSTTTYTWTKQGGKQLYQHNIYISTPSFDDIYTFIINEKSTAYTQFGDLLADLSTSILCNGYQSGVNGYTNISKISKNGYITYVTRVVEDVTINDKIIKVCKNQVTLTSKPVSSSRTITDTVVAL